MNQRVVCRVSRHPFGAHRPATVRGQDARIDSRDGRSTKDRPVFMLPMRDADAVETFHEPAATIPSLKHLYK